MRLMVCDVPRKPYTVEHQISEIIRNSLIIAGRKEVGIQEENNETCTHCVKHHEAIQVCILATSVLPVLLVLLLYSGSTIEAEKVTKI